VSGFYFDVMLKEKFSNFPSLTFLSIAVTFEANSISYVLIFDI
jgi:predicted ester cyclase